MVNLGRTNPRDLLPKYGDDIVERTAFFQPEKQQFRGEDLSCFLVIGFQGTDKGGSILDVLGRYTGNLWHHSDCDRCG